jgi:hypothetical protein
VRKSGTTNRDRHGHASTVPWPPQASADAGVRTGQVRFRDTEKKKDVALLLACQLIVALGCLYSNSLQLTCASSSLMPAVC